MSQLNDFVVSYGYRQVPGASTLLLQVLFDEDALKKILMRASQTVWGSDRPTTLVVLTDCQDVACSLRSGDSDDPLVAGVKRLSQQHGLNILLPVMDLRDQFNLSDVGETGLSVDQLQALGTRYGLKNILSVTIKEASIHWALWLNDQTYQWTTRTLNQGLDHLLEIVANRYALITSSKLQTNILLNVSGINSLKNYSQLVTMLRHSADISQVVVKDMEADQVLLAIKISGGSDALIHALKNTRLLPGQNNSGQSMELDTLYYHWGNKPLSVNTTFQPY
jgi:uncharacterized protein